MRPFNVTILDPDEYIQRKQLLPVTVPTIFEPSTTRFHPDGLYSEVIFGPIGSTERVARRGYIDLRTNIITPHLFKQIISLKGYYSDILAGKKYAYFDNELKDLIICNSEVKGADTGFTFFLKCLPNIEFKQTNSTTRRDKINLIKKYSDRLMCTRFIVIPAGVRDVTVKDGQTKGEEINKFYTALLGLVQAMPEKFSDDTLYDIVRYQIQMKVQEIYKYIANLMDGTGGFIQSKYAARHITYGSRNVITAIQISKTQSSKGPNASSVDEVQLPLFQAMKAATPLVAHKLKSIFFNEIFSTSDKIAVINPDSRKLEYAIVEPDTINHFNSTIELEKLINEFQNKEWCLRPATIEAKDENGNKHNYYIEMVYEDPSTGYIYTYRDYDDFRKEILREDALLPSGFKLPNLPTDKYIITTNSALDIYAKTEYSPRLELVVADDVYEQLKSQGEVVHDDYFDTDIILASGICESPVSICNSVVLQRLGIDFEKFKAEHTQNANGIFIQNGKSLNEIQSKGLRFSNKYQKVLKEMNLDPVGYTRPITWLEIGYIATYSALRGKHSTATRYPILNFEGIVMDKIHLMSTQPSRIVTLRHHGSADGQGLVMPEYPDIRHGAIKTSMSVFSAHLEKYDGDHDGDVLSALVLMSDEANEEIEDYLKSPVSMVDPQGSLIYGLASGRLVRYSMYSSTYHDLTKKE